MFPGKRHTIKHLGFQPVRLLTEFLETPWSRCSRQPHSLHFAQFLEHGGRVRILRIDREGFFVVLGKSFQSSRVDLSALCGFIAVDSRRTKRSEEHTSELQSRLHLVCRLLLEKKKYVSLH